MFKKNNIVHKFLFKKYPSILVEEFIKSQSSKKKTLDLGCGLGPYKKYFPNRIGVDIYKTNAVDFIGDAHNLNMFKDNSFDCILCAEVFEHLSNPQKAINEMYRILKPNGKLILTTRFIFPLHDVPEDYYRYTNYGLKHLMKRFNNVNIKEETSSFGTLAILIQRIGFQIDTLYFKPIRIFWLLLAKFIWLFRNIPTKEYGEVGIKKKVKTAFTSGYYVIAKK